MKIIHTTACYWLATHCCRHPENSHLTPKENSVESEMTFTWWSINATYLKWSESNTWCSSSNLLLHCGASTPNLLFLNLLLFTQFLIVLYTVNSNSSVNPSTLFNDRSNKYVVIINIYCMESLSNTHSKPRVGSGTERIGHAPFPGWRS